MGEIKKGELIGTILGNVTLIILAVVCFCVYFMIKRRQRIGNEQLSRTQEPVFVRSPIKEPVSVPADWKENNDVLESNTSLSVEDQRANFFIFLEKMRGFNFGNLFTKRHTFDFDNFAECVKNSYRLISGIDFSNPPFSIALSDLPSLVLLKKVFVNSSYSDPFYIRYRDLAVILKELQRLNNFFDVKVPSLLSWSSLMLYLCEQNYCGSYPDIVEIKCGNDHFFYSLGEMRDAVEQWSRYIYFNPHDLLHAFSNLVVLGKIHLNNIPANETDEFETNLDYARKFEFIYKTRNTSNWFLQRGDYSIDINEYAVDILEQLMANNVPIPVLSLDEFTVQTIALILSCNEAHIPKQLPFNADVSSLKLVLKSLGNRCHGSFVSYWVQCNSCDRHEFWLSVPLEFKLYKLRSNIAALNQFMTEVRRKDSSLVKDQRLIEIVDAISILDQFLLNITVNETKIEEMERILAIVTYILQPLQLYGVGLPILKQKKCIVHYKNGLTGDVYYRYFPTNCEIVFEEALQAIQPGLNWYTYNGEFDMTAFTIQMLQINMLGSNIIHDVKTSSGIKKTIGMFSDIHRELVYESKKDSCNFFGRIVDHFRKSDNLFVKNLIPYLGCSCVQNAADQRKHFTSKAQSNRNIRIPFYGYIKEIKQNDGWDGRFTPADYNNKKAEFMKDCSCGHNPFETAKDASIPAAWGLC